MVNQDIFVGNPAIRIIAKKKRRPILYNSIVGGWADSWLTLNNWRFGKLEVPSEEFSIIIRLKVVFHHGFRCAAGKTWS